MKVKSVITVSRTEKDSLGTVYDLMDEIDRSCIAKATIQSKILNEYKLTLGDIKNLLFDIEQLVQLED